MAEATTAVTVIDPVTTNEHVEQEISAQDESNPGIFYHQAKEDSLTRGLEVAHALPTEGPEHEEVNSHAELKLDEDHVVFEEAHQVPPTDDEADNFSIAKEELDAAEALLTENTTTAEDTTLHVVDHSSVAESAGEFHEPRHEEDVHTMAEAATSTEDEPIHVVDHSEARHPAKLDDHVHEDATAKNKMTTEDVTLHVVDPSPIELPGELTDIRQEERSLIPEQNAQPHEPLGTAKAAVDSTEHMAAHNAVGTIATLHEPIELDASASETNDILSETEEKAVADAPTMTENWPLALSPEPQPADLSINTVAHDAPVDPDHSSQPQTPTGPVSPITPSEAHDLSRDSMMSISLSETSLDYDSLSSQDVNDMLATPRVSGVRHRRKPSSLDILQNKWAPPDRQSTLFDLNQDQPLERTMSAVEADRDVWSRDALDFGLPRPFTMEGSDSMGSFDIGQSGLGGSDTPRRMSGGSSSEEEAQVDWRKLDETEEQEKEDKELPEGAEDESTAFLLARLEQENAKFSADPKASASKVNQRARAASRPPSIAHLKKLVSSRDTPTIRYSLAPDVNLPEEPPPMTELEFWAALVQDYPSTAVRLPTLTTTKIRAGIPPPLRGVVWTSMAGARDRHLEDAFDRLIHEKSPYEGIINKDVGRSFPGVELFRDSEGEGQRMLGRVLKCFSLQDKDIGYCQGLGFLVGPLLMNMGEREAFCVLVRLMDHYSLRPSFLPSLAGLHMRIFQFSSLLKQHNPKLHEHLANLGVEPAYLSQWFLSCFAVTCPLTMLFRIYDVIFAEGANETVMRVALALVRRHEAQILETFEFDEVMQLLLGREIWDCYGGDADEMVDDFTSLGEIVTHGRLSELEREFGNQSSETIGQSAGFLPDVQAAASRFLGRLWAPGHSAQSSRTVMHATKQSLSTLSPHMAERDGLASAVSLFTRPGSFLRRSPSKHSISLNDNNSSDDSASTVGSGSASLASTAPTEIDSSNAIRESVADSMSTKSLAPSTPGHHKEQQELHGQIEDLLTALSEMQREHAQMVAMLQREREERGEDHRAMKQIVGKLRKNEKDDRRQTMPAPALHGSHLEADPRERPFSVGNQREVLGEADKPKNEMEELVERLQERLSSSVRFSASLETKAQLRSTLTRTREQLAAAENQSRDLASRLEATEAALNTFQTESDDLRAEVKELRVRVADEFKAKQKLDYQVGELQAQARAIDRRQSVIRTTSNSGELPRPKRVGSSYIPRDRTTSVSSMPPGSVTNTGGLRELKLGRRDSASSVQTLRSVQRRSHRESTASEQEPPSPADVSPVDAPLPSPVIVSPTNDAPEPSAGPAPTANALGVPGSTFAPRTSSLAMQEVFATPEHEPVPEEALLLELVNSKTSEAQARQEIDELKRALQISRRKQEEGLQQLRAEMAASKLEAMKALNAAQAETAKALEAAQAARAEAEAAKLTGASAMSTPIFSLPTTPFADESIEGKGSAASTPNDEKAPAVAAPKKAETAPASTGGGWFWGRRTASKTNITVPPKVDE